MADREDPKPLQQFGAIWTSPSNVAGIGVLPSVTGSISTTIGEFTLREDWHSAGAFIVLGITPIQRLTPPPPGGALGRILARLTFGIGTASETFDLDWGLGTSVNLPAGINGHVKVDAVQCSVTNPANPAPKNAQMDQRFILTAQLAEGARSSLGLPKYTVLEDAAPVGFNEVPIPKRAKRVIVQPPLGVLSPVSVNLTSNAGTTTFICANAADAAIRTTGVELAGNDISIGLTGGELDCRVIFLLDG